VCVLNLSLSLSHTHTHTHTNTHTHTHTHTHLHTHARTTHTEDRRGVLSWLLNIFWIFNGGLQTAALWLLVGFLCCITVIGIPYGCKPQLPLHLPPHPPCPPPTHAHTHADTHTNTRKHTHTHTRCTLSTQSLSLSLSLSLRLSLSVSQARAQLLYPTLLSFLHLRTSRCLFRCLPPCCLTSVLHLRFLVLQDFGVRHAAIWAANCLCEHSKHRNIYHLLFLY
jgi:hypothetical protein